MLGIAPPPSRYSMWNVRDPEPRIPSCTFVSLVVSRYATTVFANHQGHEGTRRFATQAVAAQTVVIGVLLFFSLTVLAAPIGTPPVAYTERMWQVQNGLPEQGVQAFAHTADHYLWIGTTGGLLRFHGENFLLFDRENTPTFRENNVFFLFVARHN